MRLIERAQAVRRATAGSIGRRWWIAGAGLAVIVTSLLWAHGLALFGLFLVLVTGLAIWFEMRLFRQYRECLRTLTEIRSRLAGMMRQDFERAVESLLGTILDCARPLFIRKKYLQFIAQEVQWDLPLLGRFRHALEADHVCGDIRSYVEILIATKTGEAEMRGVPTLNDDELRALFGSAEEGEGR